MKSFALLALLGVVTAKHAGVLMQATGCPPHEPLCDDRDVSGLRPMWTKSLAQGMPGIPCPEHEPLCYNASPSALTQQKGMPGIPCPEHEPLCYNASPSALSQRNTLRQSLAQSAEPCEEALEITAANMNAEMDYFSRSFDVKHYDNAMKIFGELKKNGYRGKGPRVSSWELYDRSFSFERIRKYPNVVDWMNSLEQFQDNLNLNISNSVALRNFIKTAKSVKASISEKFHDGEWSDPASFDPQAEHKRTWANM